MNMLEAALSLVREGADKGHRSLVVFAGEDVDLLLRAATALTTEICGSSAIWIGPAVRHASAAATATKHVPEVIDGSDSGSKQAKRLAGRREGPRQQRPRGGARYARRARPRCARDRLRYAHAVLFVSTALWQVRCAAAGCCCY